MVLPYLDSQALQTLVQKTQHIPYFIHIGLDGRNKGLENIIQAGLCGLSILSQIKKVNFVNLQCWFNVYTNFSCFFD